MDKPVFRFDKEHSFLIRLLKKMKMLPIGAIIWLMLWLLGSVAIAYYSTKILGRYFLCAGDMNCSSSVDATIFSALYAVLAGAASIIFTLAKHKKEDNEFLEKKRRDNVAILMPKTVADIIATDSSGVDSQIDWQDTNLRKKHLVRYRSRIFEMIVIRQLNGFYKLHYDIQYKKRDVIFGIINVGKGYAKPIRYWILYDRPKHDDRAALYTTVDRECYITESLSDAGEYLFPSSHGSSDVIWVWGGDVFKNFFEVKPEKYTVVLEYRHTTSQNTVIQAYETIGEEVSMGDSLEYDKKVITSFRPIKKSELLTMLNQDDPLRDRIMNSDTGFYL